MSIREQWREAALKNQRQVCFIPGGGIVHRGEGAVGGVACAISLVGGWLPFGTLADGQRTACPVEGCTYTVGGMVSQLAVHLNNVHQWDWLMLANKFPPILPEDQP